MTIELTDKTVYWLTRCHGVLAEIRNELRKQNDMVRCATTPPPTEAEVIESISAYDPVLDAGPRWEDPS